MASTPQYAGTVRSAAVVVSAANTNRDGTGTIVTVLTAGSAGTRIDDITVIATGTTTTGMVRLFLHNGTDAKLLREIPVTAATPSSTVAAFSSSITSLALVIPTGYSLRASTALAETFNVIVTRAGDF
tara:strand:- start:432 stop:815 length:384 start_codon:yes stop_codon:yes gene_type:complete